MSDDTDTPRPDDSTQTTQHTCPVCEREVAPRDDNPRFPFCSKRCKQVDLGRWLNEEVSIPMTPNSTERSLEEDDSEQ